MSRSPDLRLRPLTPADESTAWAAQDELAADGFEQALVTCDDDNVGSATVIERCGGVLQDVVGSKRRYWVPTGG